MTWSSYRIFLAACLVVAPFPARASFSLDEVKQDYWYYVHNHLADSTSAECLAAYAAPIDCDETLLGFVSSGSPNFNPGPTDLESTCTATCSDALDAYVENVKSACTAPGDGALVHGPEKPMPAVGVDVVGQVFRYEYARVCSRNSTGWCYFYYSYGQDPYYASSDFPCKDECSVNFMEAAHDYATGSSYTFSVYELSTLSTWWQDVFEKGWKTVQRCRDGDDGGIWGPGDGPNTRSEIFGTPSGFSTTPTVTFTPSTISAPTSTTGSALPTITPTQTPTTTNQESAPSPTETGGDGTGAGSRLGGGYLTSWAVSVFLFCLMFIW